MTNKVRFMSKLYQMLINKQSVKGLIIDVLRHHKETQHFGICQLCRCEVDSLKKVVDVNTSVLSEHSCSLQFTLQIRWRKSYFYL